MKYVTLQRASAAYRANDADAPCPLIAGGRMMGRPMNPYNCLTYNDKTTCFINLFAYAESSTSTQSFPLPALGGANTRSPSFGTSPMLVNSPVRGLNQLAASLSPGKTPS